MRPLPTPRRSTPVLAIGAFIVLGLLLVLPTLVLLVRALAPARLPDIVRPAALEALRLSLLTTSISIAITLLLGTPVAYLLARRRFFARGFLDALIDMPIVLPPVVAGVSLLLVFGRRGLLGAPLHSLGIDLAFTTTAVVMAQVFVASPYFIRTMKAGFASVPQRLEAVSWTLGKSERTTFWRVTFPLALPYLVEGTVLAWARALGEFGATIVFAGSLAGRTRTLPLAIYAALERDLDSALSLSALLAVTAFVLLVAFRLALRRDTGTT